MNEWMDGWMARYASSTDVKLMVLFEFLFLFFSLLLTFVWFDLRVQRLKLSGCVCEVWGGPIYVCLSFIEFLSGYLLVCLLGRAIFLRC